MIARDEILKIRACAPLLDHPAPEVVGKLAEALLEAMDELEQCQKDGEEYVSRTDSVHDDLREAMERESRWVALLRLALTFANDEEWGWEASAVSTFEAIKRQAKTGKLEDFPISKGHGT